MKTFPAGLDTLLATGTYVFADLYDFTLGWDSSHLRYTTADTDVVYGGNRYTSKGPYFDQVASQSRGHWKLGVDVDSWQVTIQPSIIDPVTGANFPAQIYNLPWLEQVRNGALDAATVDIHRAYWAAWPQPWSSPLTPTYVLVDLFAGRVAQIDVSRTAAYITINSWVELLQRQMPRNVFSAGCRFTLFDQGCQLVRSSFQQAGVVVTVANDQIFSINVGQPDGYFTLGTIQWVTGSNTPYSKSISQHATNVIYLRSAMPYQVMVGDSFFIWPGCDKTLATCTNTFNNAINFGGFPFIPAPETSV
jgi:uncharacterized phage protein (TIGR02218 family)